MINGPSPWPAAALRASTSPTTSAPPHVPWGPWMLVMPAGGRKLEAKTEGNPKQLFFPFQIQVATFIQEWDHTSLGETGWAEAGGPGGQVVCNSLQWASSESLDMHGFMCVLREQFENPLDEE